MPLKLETTTGAASSSKASVAAKPLTPTPTAKSAPAPTKLPAGHVRISAMKKGTAFKMKSGRTEEVYVKSAVKDEAFSLTRCDVATFTSDESAEPINITIERK